jgi:nicotinate-nucleotide pyrophosphorylase (carboxylating)
MDLSRLPAVRKLIELALAEDLDHGDPTTSAVFADSNPNATGVIVARAPLVIFGLDVAATVFREVDADLKTELRGKDGDFVPAGTELIRIAGPVRSLLSAERTALNFLMRLCGVATFTRAFVKEIEGTGAKIVDTRKTMPGFRVLDKAAVKAGGGHNHRADLGSGVLIKDNHIAAAGSVEKAVLTAKKHAPHSLRVEVEVDTLLQLDQAIAAGADLVLLDNMSVEEVKKAAAVAKPKGVEIEVSGGLKKESVRAYALAGADLLSIGALTHSAPAADVALDLQS